MNGSSDGPVFEPIFNGTDLAGWDGDARFWRVEDGMIIGETTEDNPTEANTFLIWEEGEPGDFELRFQIRFLTEAGNSGIQVRSERFLDEETPQLEHRVRGYQPDFAVSDWIPGILYEEGGRGILARRGQRVHMDAEGERHEEIFADEEELGAYINPTEWNDYHVIVQGNTLRSRINGELMHELIDDSPEARREGIIAFQLHQGPPTRLALRAIELAELPPDAPTSF
ncbi:MAG: DUF1080 domain-containing protein [Rhodothermales bacterium]